MMVTLRLYRQHDLDLIALYRHPKFSLPAAIKKALFSYVRQETLYIKQPEPYPLPNEKISKIIQMHIQLNEKEDHDIIQWIKNTKDGYRNSALKNIVRGYLNGGYIYAYQKGNKIKEANENIILFENNVKESLEISSKKTQRKKKTKQDNTKIEDSKLAKEVLSTEPKQKPKSTYIESIDDDKHKNIENEILQESISNNIDKNSQESPQDMWGDIDSMMDSF